MIDLLCSIYDLRYTAKRRADALSPETSYVIYFSNSYSIVSRDESFHFEFSGQEAQLKKDDFYIAYSRTKVSLENDSALLN